MGDTYIIDGKLLMILGGLLSLLAGVLGWIASAYFKRIERGFEAVDARLDKLDKKAEERHRGVQATLLDLTYQVGRLEGARGVQDRSADRSGQPSPRRNDHPAPTPRGAPDPAPVAERHDRSVVSLAGVRPEPAVPTGLARQAVPGQKQTGQQDTETDLEPHEEDAPETTR